MAGNPSRSACSIRTIDTAGHRFARDFAPRRCQRIAKGSGWLVYRPCRAAAVFCPDTPISCQPRHEIDQRPQGGSTAGPRSFSTFTCGSRITGCPMVSTHRHDHQHEDRPLDRDDGGDDWGSSGRGTWPRFEHASGGSKSMRRDPPVLASCRRVPVSMEAESVRSLSEGTAGR